MPGPGILDKGFPEFGQFGGQTLQTGPTVMHSWCMIRYPRQQKLHL